MVCVLRFLCGEVHKTGTGPSHNRTNIAVPDLRSLQRKINGESRELMVHSRGVDLAPSIALGKEMLAKKLHSFLCMQIDAIHPGQTIEFVEYDCAKNKLIGSVDHIGDRTVHEVEMEFFHKRETAIEHIQRLYASKVNDVWNPLNVENPSASLNFVVGWLIAKKRHFASVVIPNLLHASREASKPFLSKKRVVDSDLQANETVNASRFKFLETLEFRYNTLLTLHKQTTHILGLLVVLLVLLEELLEEITLCGYVRRGGHYFIGDLARWKHGFQERIWRELLINVVNQTSLLELNWETIMIAAADQVAAFVVVDSMSGKNSTASICAISGSVRSFTTDGEFLSLIGNPFGDSQYTLYCSLHQGTELNISQLLEGKKGISRSLYQANAITANMEEYLSTRHLVHQLPPPILTSEANVWLRQSRSLIVEPQPFSLLPSVAIEFVRQLVASASSSNLTHYSSALYIAAQSIVLHMQPSLFFPEGNRPTSLPTIEQLYSKYFEEFQLLVEVTIEFYVVKQSTVKASDSHHSIEDQDLLRVWRVLQHAILPKSSHLTYTPMSKVLSSILFHVRHSIDLALNRQHVKSDTSLNLDIYCPLPHPLDESKSLLINPDYCAADYEGIGSFLEGILDAAWFCRDKQNVELGKKAFSNTTRQYLSTEGNVTGAEFLEDVSNLYRAIDERGISNSESIQGDGAAGFGELSKELVSEGVDLSVVLFIGRAVFGNNFVEQVKLMLIQLNAAATEQRPFKLLLS
ncbi:hypothetical protein BDR26DRAFT_938895 [Obelidium mucronatum]|nr:hypothetical protein BDR26DRAFT_938895 [Obelidium mucronatum]